MFWREKRWHFQAVAGDAGIVAAAVVNLGYMGLGFAYAFDRKTSRQRRFEVKTPLGLGAVVPLEPDTGFSRLSTPGGLILIDPIEGRLEVRTHEFTADFDVSVGTPFDTAWMIPTAGVHRTRKRMGGSAIGKICWDGDETELSGGVLGDWSRGELAPRTHWLWAAGTGLAGHRQFSFNLRAGFDDPTQAENVMWVEGVPEPLGHATITPGADGAPWHVEAGDLVLEFLPDGEHVEDLDFGLVASRYRQPWGRFTGRLGDRSVEAYGVMEEHWARW